jgi:hypothetical protein
MPLDPISFSGTVVSFPEGDAVAFVMPSPGDWDGLHWDDGPDDGVRGRGFESDPPAGDSWPGTQYHVVPDTADEYAITWTFAVDVWDSCLYTVSFELRLNGTAIDSVTLPNIYGSPLVSQRTVSHALAPGDVLTVWCTSGSSGDNVFLRYVRIRVRG